MSKYTPEHFRNAAHFKAYILELAIENREALLEAYAKCDPDKETKEYLSRTKDEIRAMKQRLKRCLNIKTL
jgi:Mg2+ and Co2+ transporter CorA